MMRRQVIWLCLVWGVCGMVMGQEKPPAPELPEPSQAVQAPAEDLSEAIKGLKDDAFNKRQAAVEKLRSAGLPGIEAVAKAAESDDLDLALTCVGILRDALESPDEKIKDAAKKALERLAKSQHASIAQRAERALEPAPPPFRNGRLVPAVPPFPFGAQPGMRVRVSVQVTNGKMRIAVTENDREIQIEEDPGKSVSVTVTDVVKGQKETKTYQAKDPDELKKLHPEAFALYEKYTRKPNNPFGAVPPGGVPAFPAIGRQRQPRMINPFKAADFFDQLGEAQKELDAATQKLQKLSEGNANVPSEEVQKIIQELREATTKLQNAQKDIDRP